MKASQANRAVIARRAPAATPNRDSSIPLTSTTVILPVGYEGVRRHGNKRTSKGGSSTGGVNGCWRTVAPSYRDTATHDSRWGQTVRNRNV